jgi:hypothetical protein
MLISFISVWYNFLPDNKKDHCSWYCRVFDFFFTIGIQALVVKKSVHAIWSRGAGVCKEQVAFL